MQTEHTLDPFARFTGGVVTWSFRPARDATLEQRAAEAVRIVRTMLLFWRDRIPPEPWDYEDIVKYEASRHHHTAEEALAFYDLLDDLTHFWREIQRYTQSPQNAAPGCYALKIAWALRPPGSNPWTPGSDALKFFMCEELLAISKVFEGFADECNPRKRERKAS